MTNKGIELFNELPSDISFLPVTTRTANQYQRITGLFNAQYQNQRMQLLQMEQSF